MPPSSDEKPAAQRAPITVRLDAEHHETLQRLSAESSSSEVLRQGLRLLGHAQTPSGAPLYPWLVNSPEVQEAIERATAAACEVLDEFFVGRPAETQGISSNFQGTLKEHIEAMLTGRSSATWRYRRHVNALFGDGDSFGRVSSASRFEGYTVVQRATRSGDEDLFFHCDRNAFVPLAQLPAGVLYNRPEIAVKEVFAWLDAEQRSPRDAELRLCKLSYEAEGPLRVVEVAS